MSQTVVVAPWASRHYRVRAFFLNSDALIVDRGVYDFDVRTVDDDPDTWEWLYTQLDSDRVCSGDVTAADLIYEYKRGNTVIGRDRRDGSIRLILANAS